MEKLSLLERAQYDIISETENETETVTVLRVRHSGAKVICRVPKHTPEEERQIAANVTRALTQIAYSGQAESDEELAQQWADLAIPPYEENICEPKEKVCEPKENHTLEDVQDIPRIVKDIPFEDAIIIGPHIIEDEQLMSAVNKKLKELAAERQVHAERIEIIDNTLRKYAFFLSDCSSLIESEGIEL